GRLALLATEDLPGSGRGNVAAALGVRFLLPLVDFRVQWVYDSSALCAQARTFRPTVLRQKALGKAGLAGSRGSWLLELRGRGCESRLGVVLGEFGRQFVFRSWKLFRRRREIIADWSAGYLGCWC